LTAVKSAKNSAVKDYLEQSMELKLFGPDETPKPRAEIRIEAVRVTPYPDGWRVKLNIDVTPFQERPSLEIYLRRDGKPIAELSVIETMHRQMEFTLHVRGVTNAAGTYEAEVTLYYEDRLQPQHRQQVLFEITPTE
jgi:hypothetical protein